jgi:hypothetical protein
MYSQIAKPIDPPKDLMAINAPVVTAIRAGGVLSCATVTRHVRLQPMPKPRIAG